MHSGASVVRPHSQGLEWAVGGSRDSGGLVKAYIIPGPAGASLHEGLRWALVQAARTHKSACTAISRTHRAPSFIRNMH